MKPMRKYFFCRYCGKQFREGRQRQLTCGSPECTAAYYNDYWRLKHQRELMKVVPTHTRTITQSRKWSCKEVRTLLRGFRNGLAPLEIAALLTDPQRTPRQVTTKANRLRKRGVFIPYTARAIRSGRQAKIEVVDALAEKEQAELKLPSTSQEEFRRRLSEFVHEVYGDQAPKLEQALGLEDA